MKANIITLVLILIALCSNAQITYEKGYFIDNQNNRVECLIKNNDWKNNPKEFEYKLTEHANSETGSFRTVKEFGVYGYSKFVKADTKIDLSSMTAASLSKDRNPEWSQELIFLKVLVEGKATLYYFERDGLIRFFYSLSDSAAKQLIYKEFVSDNGKVSGNITFRGQLWNDLKCATTKMSDVESINYRKNELEKYFRKYNECNGSLSQDYNRKEKKNLFHLKIAPGINYASTKELLSGTTYIDFGKKITYSLGLEAELVLPFNKNKWSLIFEPTYQYFKSETERNLHTVSMDYKSMECQIGLRHYFFLNQYLKLFVNAEYLPMFRLKFNSIIDTKGVDAVSSMAFGGGFGYKKLSVEFRWYSNQDLLASHSSMSTDYQRIGAIFGFKIF